MPNEKNRDYQDRLKRDEERINKSFPGDRVNESVREKRLHEERSVPKRNTIKYETKDDTNDDFFKKK
ncbi:MAG: Glycogen biosynthesis protein GlgD [Enterococcus gilvus]|jgi:hypothetical protein|uniref:hypothetical protein n=1 Tax=Enterococcus TaxID=1350 RepID=UPI0039F54C33